MIRSWFGIKVIYFWAMKDYFKSLFDFKKELITVEVAREKFEMVLIADSPLDCGHAPYASHTGSCRDGTNGRHIVHDLCFYMKDGADSFTNLPRLYRIIFYCF